MDGKTRFSKLLEPSYIGRVRTRNRIIKTGADMGFCDDNGYVTEKLKAFYEALARGGVGLIIIESPTVESPSISWPSSQRPLQLGLDDDKYIKSFSELTKITHKYGCPTFTHLHHWGAWDAYSLRPVDVRCASTLTKDELSKLRGPNLLPPRGLSIAEVEEFIEKFAATAERAQKAGIDGVEINADTCHLCNSFLSRTWNKRQDSYGCESLQNRSRFVVEIIRRIKKRLGQDFPVSILFNVAEFGVDKGTTIEEAQGFAQIFQEAGADAIHARAYGYGDFFNLVFADNILYPEPPERLPKELDWSRKGAGAMVPLAEAIKKVVSIPVITINKLDPVLGEKILRQGKADFIGMNRRLLADPELPNKIAAGRLEDIAPCTACLHCISAIYFRQPCICRTNGALGGEQDYEIKQAEKRKKVVVVGAGPAGMEAARVAAIRGHEVSLYEREHKLGGLLPLAALVKGLEIEDLVDMVRYLKTQITKLGVKVRLGKEFTPSLIEEIKPDVVILAMGGTPTLLEIPGINRRSVVSSADLHRKLKTYLRFLGPEALGSLTRFWMPVGKKVVIIGGEMQGCQLAEFLVKRGRKVTIVETSAVLGGEMPVMKRKPLLAWLTRKGATMMTEVKCEEITDRGLTIVTRGGERQTIAADTIVPATPFKPNNELLKALKGKVPEIYSIGDCNEPRLIVDAIADAYRIARAM